MKKGYCLNVCTKKKTTEEARDTETAEGRNSKYYFTDIINMPCSGTDSIKTKQNNSFYLCNSTPIVPQ